VARGRSGELSVGGLHAPERRCVDGIQRRPFAPVGARRRWRKTREEAKPKACTDPRLQKRGTVCGPVLRGVPATFLWAGSHV